MTVKKTGEKTEKTNTSFFFVFTHLTSFYSGPSEPTITPEPIRPLALVTKSAWWTEGWFKIVVALGGLIIVAILVATFIVVGRNNSRKEQVGVLCACKQG